MNRGIIFIHGAGLGSYIWDEIKPLIKHPALYIDLPNRNGGDKVNSTLTFNDYISLIKENINQSGFDEFIIVAHSIGGILGIEVAEYFGKKVVGFIGISATIPNKGESFVLSLPFFKSIFLTVVMRFIGTKPPESAIRKGLCNDLSELQTQKVIGNFTPEAMDVYNHKSTANIPDVRSLYVKTTKDEECLISVQDKMAKNLNAKNTIKIESGHLPMMSKPVQLAEILNVFVDSY